MMPTSSKQHSEENRIPDYEHLFGDAPSKPKKSIRVILDMFQGYGLRLLWSQILCLIKSSPLWVMPILTAEIINIASSPIDDNSYRNIILYSLVLVIILLQNVPTHMLYAKENNAILRSIGAGIRSSLFRKLQQLSITYHKQIATGTIQSKFLRDIESVNGLVSTLLLNVLPSLLGVVISVVISLTHSVMMTLFFVVVVPTNVILTKLFYKQIAKKNREYRIENENVSASFTSKLQMLTVTKAHGLESREIRSFDHKISALTEKGLRADRTSAYFGAWVWVLSNLLSSSCLVLCAFLALNGRIEVGDIVLYQSLFSLINGYVSSLVNAFPTMVSGMEGISSLSEIMLSDDVERQGSYRFTELRGKIDFDHVSYSYPDKPENFVIHDLDLHVAPGECIAFVGSSGCGKSTVMNLIIGFLTATEGSVRIDGRDLNEVDLRRYRKHISVVPQNSILFPGTIRENITYGLGHYSEEDLQRVLDMANITEFLPNLPNGIDSQVGECGDRLSGGQRQRITIARALIRNPSILILDEATSALDNVSEYHVQKAIEKLIHGRTTFIVAHRLSTIRNADRIVVMDAGRCVEIGTYEELIEKHGKFYELKALNDMATTMEASV